MTKSKGSSLKTSAQKFGNCLQHLTIVKKNMHIIYVAEVYI